MRPGYAQAKHKLGRGYPQRCQQEPLSTFQGKVAEARAQIRWNDCLRSFIAFAGLFKLVRTVRLCDRSIRPCFQDPGLSPTRVASSFGKLICSDTERASRKLAPVVTTICGKVIHSSVQAAPERSFSCTSGRPLGSEQGYAT